MLKTRRFGNYALLNAPTAAALERLQMGKNHVDKQYAAMQAAHSEWARLVQREPELSAVCAELPDLLRKCGKTFYHQHSQVLQWFRQPGDCLAANCRTELDTYDTKKYPQRITRYQSLRRASQCASIIKVARIKALLARTKQQNLQLLKTLV